MQTNVVGVPNLTHSTVEQILAINSHLIKVLMQYQNYGWLEEPEYKIYQARLQSNLTFLATAADYMGKPDPSRINSILTNQVSLSPVMYPEKLKHMRKATTASSAPSSTSLSKMDAKSKPANGGLPTMVVDKNVPDVVGDASGIVLDYKPVPPFAMPEGLMQPPGLSAATLLGMQDTRAMLERRFGGSIAGTVAMPGMPGMPGIPGMPGSGGGTGGIGE
ncbi:hypothetical protein BJ741DRAFT_587381 [Chytriomyces cf. hyalinus JEL632]|nr:hypothetical protein BJ741DRAFT_587381 [Chytriomyces cf. hyalinus JEL632]